MLEILDISQSDAWKQALDELPDSARDVYFLPEYYLADSQHRRVSVKCAVLRAPDGIAIYPFYLKDINSLGLIPDDQPMFDIEGAYGYNGLAASSQTAATDFYNNFSNWCANNHIVAEFTRFHPLSHNHHWADGYMRVNYMHDTVFINLEQDYESIWNHSYSAVNRNMIRKSLKNSVECRVSDNWNAFTAMYERTMTHLNARDELYFPEQYYRILRDGFGKYGTSLLLEAHINNHPAAMMILLISGNFAHYHLSARDPQFSSSAAGNALLDFAVKTASQHQAKIFHLGGGLAPDDSLMRFKAGFSKQRAPFHIGRKIHNPQRYNQLCEAWSAKHPEKTPQYTNFLLKYWR